MPPLQITTTDFGGVSYLTWLRTPSNVQPVDQLADFVQPTQDQYVFQKRWFYFDAQLAGIGQNDAFQFVVQCPPNESWRIDYILVFHDQALNRDFSIFIDHFPALPSANLSLISRVPVTPNVTVGLYPTRFGRVAPQTTDYEYAEPMFVLQGERLRIESAANPNPAAIQTAVTIRYEHIPVPVEGPRLSPILPSVTTI